VRTQVFPAGALAIGNEDFATVDRASDSHSWQNASS
jgi:hypothetical protein